MTLISVKLVQSITPIVHYSNRWITVGPIIHQLGSSACRSVVCRCADIRDIHMHSLNQSRPLIHTNSFCDDISAVDVTHNIKNSALGTPVLEPMQNYLVQYPVDLHVFFVVFLLEEILQLVSGPVGCALYVLGHRRLVAVKFPCRVLALWNLWTYRLVAGIHLSSWQSHKISTIRFSSHIGTM